ncbi:GNAT family N-acetyltransferase [bacterium]|nr:GNAT family N-acetyltransferase [bacterium]NCQ54776.1 GNAT family N-acetyltransferase [Candidatus Parcubacteria bacterium]NCS95766.1 GNAT family N-acetyltransferase [bacterium]
MVNQLDQLPENIDWEIFPSYCPVTQKVQDFYREHWLEEVHGTYPKSALKFLDSAEVLVLREGDEIIGLIDFNLEEGHPNLVVRPDKRRQGYGTWLIKKSVEMIIEKSSPMPNIHISLLSVESLSPANAAKEAFKDRALIVID